MVRSVEIPGDIMETTIVLGLTVSELVALFGSPIILILPSMYIKQIPLSFSLGFVIISLPVILYLIAQTPPGQSPISWIAATVNRRITPDTYHLKPGEGRRATAKYLDVVHTADQLQTEGKDRREIEQSTENTND